MSQVMPNYQNSSVEIVKEYQNDVNYHPLKGAAYSQLR